MRGMDNGRDTTETCPRPLLRQDASALVGLLSIVEGELTLRQFDPDLVDHMRGRSVPDGLLTPDASGRDLRQALADITQRLHYAAGTYDQPPALVPVPE